MPIEYLVNFESAGIIPIEDRYHDHFLFSELKGNKLEVEEEFAGNGITKVFIGSPNSNKYLEGEPVVIYRIYKQPLNGRTYRSAVTSFTVIKRVEVIKKNGQQLQPLDEFISGFREESLANCFWQVKNIAFRKFKYVAPLFPDLAING